MNYIAQAINVLLSRMEEDRKKINLGEEARKMMRIAKICRRISIGCFLTYYILKIGYLSTNYMFVLYKMKSKNEKQSNVSSEFIKLRLEPNKRIP
ncbi:odorant receptor 13a-like [Vespula maculifrons]|uniref:Odorant receptor 13a-like n=1 Tax=Vespula maculifrons TaxID=7453 RepID=A0ABD2C2G9_VESMC